MSKAESAADTVIVHIEGDGTLTIMSKRGEKYPRITVNQKTLAELPTLNAKCMNTAEFKEWWREKRANSFGNYARPTSRVTKPLNTPETCLAAIMMDGRELEFVPKKFKTPELCFAAVLEYGMALEYVLENLKTPEICLAAVESHGFALEYVPEELKTLKICLAAVQSNFRAIEYAPKALHHVLHAAIGPPIFVIGVGSSGINAVNPYDCLRFAMGGFHRC
jgi:hypothetical protein